MVLEERPGERPEQYAHRQPRLAWFAIIFAACLTSGCLQVVAPLPDVKEEIRARDEVEYQKDLQSKAFADKRTSEAKGTKTCIIKQYTSAYRAQQLRPLAVQNPYTYVYSSKLSNLHFRVDRSGRIGVAVTDTTYPRLKSFFLIDGSRFSAEGGYFADVTAALPALKGNAEIKYAWHEWPYKSEVNQTDVFARFSDAYDDCLKFLKNAA